MENSLYLVEWETEGEAKEGETTNIEVMELGLNIIEIVHPVTYINKIIAYSENQILLVNPISRKILYNYETVVKELLVDHHNINLVCPSPLVDIVAVCLDSGLIIILNIRTSRAVFNMKQKLPVTAIAFSDTSSLMATGDSSGNILMWDLENKTILYRL
jgi:WD40 repeat protein